MLDEISWALLISTVVVCVTIYKIAHSYIDYLGERLREGRRQFDLHKSKPNKGYD